MLADANDVVDVPTSVISPQRQPPSDEDFDSTQLNRTP